VSDFPALEPNECQNGNQFLEYVVGVVCSQTERTWENCPLTFKGAILCETVGITNKGKEEFVNFLDGKTCLNSLILAFLKNPFFDVLLTFLNYS